MKEWIFGPRGTRKMFFVRIFSILVLSIVSVLAANPPGSVTGTAASCTTIQVSWTAASGNGGNTPTNYEIYRDNTNTLIATVAATVLSYPDTAAGSNSVRTYLVRTKASNGSVSTFASSSPVSTVNQCPPGAPTGLNAASPSCTQVSLSWTPPTLTGAGLVGYRVYRNNTYLTQVAGTSYLNSGLSGNTSYTYDVSAVDSASRESVKTRVVTSTPACGGGAPPPGPPGNVLLSMQGANNVLTWPGSTNVKYQVECSAGFGMGWQPVDAPTTTFNAAHVRIGSSLMYRVTWYTNTPDYKNNWSLYSGDMTAPTTISTYNASELPGAQIRLDWSASSDTQSGLKGYLLYRDNTFLTFATNGVTTYLDVTGNGVSSDYDIAAMDRAGNVTTKVRSVCTYTLSSGSWTAPACGAGTSVYVSSSRTTCSWSASSPCGWLTVTPSGTGSGWVTLTAASNATGASRSCTVTIAGVSFSVTQAACGCNYTISTSSSPSAGGSTSGGGTVNCNSSVTVSATPNAGYTFVNWTEGVTSVSTSASYTFTATANRTLVAYFAAAPTCSLTLTPSSSSFGNSGGSGSFTAYTGSSCSRNATANVAWITITSGGTGSGNGSVGFSVAANTGAARSGTITVSVSGSNLTYTAYQDAAAVCTYSLTPTNVYFSSAAATGSSIVSAGAGCSWAATSLDNWITITSGSSGTGGGTVAYSVAANSSVANDRVGRIRVVGGSTTNALTINQDRNLAPNPNAGGGISNVVGSAVSMDASASWDEDGAIVSYAWNYGDGTTGSGVAASHAYAAAGTYNVTVTTTDDLGASSTANKSVAVNPAPDTVAPTVTWSSPANNSTLSNTVTLTAAATDNSGGSGVLRVEFYRDGNIFLGSDTTSPYSLSYDTTSTPNGAHTYFCRAVDNAGNVAETPTRTFTVNNSASAPGLTLWMTSVVSSGSDSGEAVAVDSNGNVYSTGTTAGNNMYLQKHSAAGQLLWSQTFFGTIFSHGITVDSSGNIYITGEYLGSINLGGSSLSGSIGSYAMFVAKYDTSGTHVWSRGYLGVGQGNNVGRGIVLDSNNNVIITGVMYSLDFGGGATLTGAGGGSSFVARLSGADGSHLWSRHFGMGQGCGTALATDSGGNIYVTGYYYNSIDFGGGATLTAPIYGGYLVKLNSGGSHVWSKNVSQFNSTLYGLGGRSVAVAPNGDVALTGAFVGTMNLGGNNLVAGSTSVFDFYFARFTSAGAHVWSRSLSATGGGTSGVGNGVVMDSSGNSIFTGRMYGTIDYGGQSATSSNMSSFVVKYSSTGTIQWLRAFDGNNMGNAIAADSQNRLVVIGRWSSNCDFGLGNQASSGGTFDSYQVKLAP